MTLSQTLGLLLLTLPFAQAPPEQTEEPAPAPVLEACGLCSGEGLVELPCDRCDPRGKVDCDRCGPEETSEASRFRLAVHRLNDPEGAAELEKRLAGLRATVEAFGQILPGGPRESVPGKIACPASCFTVSPYWRNPPSCKTCKGREELKCSPCKGKGVFDCRRCRGKKRARVLCPECVGGGQSRAFGAQVTGDPASCPWCLGGPNRTCWGCVEDAPRPPVCETCGGKKKLLCRPCRGSGYLPCRRCGSRGKTHEVVSGQTRRCRPCDGDGRLSCEQCKRGKTTCPACDKDPETEHACDTCLDFEKTICSGCWDGGALAWEIVADRLVLAGKDEEALSWFERGQERERDRVESLTQDFEGDADQREANERRHSQRLDRLSSKADKVRERLEK